MDDGILVRKSKETYVERNGGRGSLRKLWVKAEFNLSKVITTEH